MRDIPSCLLLIFYIILCSVSGMFSAKSVILSSMEIFSTHEWLSPQPVIYFQCQGEIKIILPDVKEKNFVYKFKGIESWQRMTQSLGFNYLDILVRRLRPCRGPRSLLSTLRSVILSAVKIKFRSKETTSAEKKS